MRAARPLRKLAAACGPPLVIAPDTPHTVAANLAVRVAERPDGIIRSYGAAGTERSQSYAETWRRAGSILAGMRAFGVAPGRVVVLLIEDVVDFVPAYWACIRGGFVVAPLMSVARDRSQQRSPSALGLVLNRLDEAAILTDDAFAAIAATEATERGFGVLPLRIAEANAGSDFVDAPAADPLCLIPSSGSTGTLKLIALGHDSILYRQFADPFQPHASYLGTVALDSVSIAQHGVFLSYGSWTQISPVALTVQPTSVLDAIARHRINLAGCTPSTAKTIVAAAQRSGRTWDLSFLTEFGVGAEPVAIKSMQMLGDFLEQSGSSRRIIRARYGTTETGFLVTGAHLFAGANDNSHVARLGTCAPGVELRIVGDDDRMLDDGDVGEVQVNSPQRMFSSYWGDPEATRASFTADGWWHTGDLGRLGHGELSLHGRAKDVLIVSGKKFSLAEIDGEVETVLAADERAFSCAVHWPEETAERLAVVVAAADGPPPQERTESIRAVVDRRFGLRPDPVLATSLDNVPLAANGKLRRNELADRIRQGLFARQGAITTPTSPPQAATATDLDRALADIWRDALGLGEQFDKAANFFDLGGDSLRALILYTSIETQFGRQISAEDFFAAPTFAGLLRLLPIGSAASITEPASAIRRQELAAELEAASALGRDPNYDRASSNQWEYACHMLWEAGRFATEIAARSLHRKFPDQYYVRTLVRYFDALPHHLPPPLPFYDDPAAEIQIVKRPNCDNVLLCFCAKNGTLGLPLNFVHEWLGRLPTSLVYIKDFRNLRGGRGFPTLGPDRDAAVTALRCIADKIGGKRIYTLGVSLGGFAALYYGLALEAEASVNFGGATDYTPEFVRTIGQIFDNYFEFCEQAPDYAVNLGGLFATARRRPRVALVYSAGHAEDRQQAEQLAGLSNVELLAVDSALHNVVDPLVRRREFLTLLQRFLSDRTLKDA
jgi:acyl-CoA synthetase (AMP-forming)/AMP-acid ligase II/acyl carrier protein